MNEKYMKLAIKEAKKSYKQGDVPVGCVIIKNNQIVSKGHNQKEKKQCLTKHAEIIAIEKACKKIKNWRLENCEMYITMEPCIMCSGAIIQSKIKKVFYSINNNNFGGTPVLKEVFKKNNIELIKINNFIEPKLMLQKFFKTKR